jgi:hypothetical protein
VTGPVVSALTDTPGGQVLNTGSGPVELGGLLVDKVGNGAGVASPSVIPSVVKVAPGEGKGIVSLPTTILLGPIMTVDPSGSVTVSKPVPIVKVLPSRTITAVGLEVGAVFTPPGGSSVNVNPSEVMVVGAVILGKEMVSDPTTIPLGPSVIVCPSGSVNTSEEAGRLNDDPPMIIPPGTEVCEGEVGKVSVVPGIVVSDPSGSVETEGGIVTTEPPGPVGSVSVVPGIVVKDPSGSVETDGGIVTTEPPGPVGSVSVVPGIVVKDPSGSVETEGGIITTEPLGPVGSVSVVPGIVVKDPSGSVETEGGIVTTELPGPTPDPPEPVGIVSVVPDIVVSEPFGSVETEGGIVVTDPPPGDPVGRVSVVPEMVVNDPFGSVETDGGITVTDSPCPVELVDKVSVVPEIVVTEPLGSVSVVGKIVVTDPLFPEGWAEEVELELTVLTD